MQVDVEPSAVHEHEPEQVKRATSAFRSAYELAVRRLGLFVAWVRTDLGQSWLGLSSEQPEKAYSSVLLEAETGTRLPIGFPEHLVAVIFDWEDALKLERALTLWNLVGQAQQPPLPETLMCDAEALVFVAGTKVADPVRAILMAAIACEVKAKAVLSERIDPARADLLEFILESPREVTVTAATTLFDKLIKRVQGRSLREEDKPLFREICELFEARNAVAHRAELPTVEESQRLVRAARRAFQWLDGSVTTPSA
jgi:hypothetical protein